MGSRRAYESRVGLFCGINPLVVERVFNRSATGQAPDKDYSYLWEAQELAWWSTLRDWQTLVVGLLAVAVAVPTYLSSRGQVLGIKAALQADSMLRLTEKLDSPDFARKRQKAAEACLNNIETRRPGVDVDDVL